MDSDVAHKHGLIVPATNDSTQSKCETHDTSATGRTEDGAQTPNCYHSDTSSFGYVASSAEMKCYTENN
ncbi:hypothetical protein EAF00_005198 [Botryotinia globosa]|nr:hypothetical protein EAF00_005198 [Botryotinia globosa]